MLVKGEATLSLVSPEVGENHVAKGSPVLDDRFEARLIAA